MLQRCEHDEINSGSSTANSMAAVLSDNIERSCPTMQAEATNIQATEGSIVHLAGISGEFYVKLIIIVALKVKVKAFHLCSIKRGKT